jgi:hypothetical protein
LCCAGDRRLRENLKGISVGNRRSASVGAAVHELWMD